MNFIYVFAYLGHLRVPVKENIKDLWRDLRLFDTLIRINHFTYNIDS